MNGKCGRKERKLKKLAAELFLSGELDEAEYAESSWSEPTLRRKIRAKRKKEAAPKIYFDVERDFSRPVSVAELQRLVLGCVLHAAAPLKCRFCQIVPFKAVSQTVLVLVDCDPVSEEVDISRNEFQFFRSAPFVSDNFPHRFYLNFQNEAYFYSTFFTTPISLADRLKLSADGQLASNGCCSEEADLAKDGCPNKVDLLMSLSDMAEDNYPLPEADDPAPRFDFAYSLAAYAPVTNGSPVFAVDCEMCMTGPNRRELTRVSIVDESLNVVLDTLVKPANAVTNYLTRFSGITETMLRYTATTLTDVRRLLKRVLPKDAILCGHSLQNDLESLRVFHPYSMDISVLYNLSGNRSCRTSLRTLSQMFLGETIQDSPKGHCSVQDAYATMKLLRLKISNGIRFGNVRMGWNYNAFAGANGIHATSGVRKRKLDDERSDISEKRAKLESNPPTGSDCKGCGSASKPNCRNSDCVCRTLSRSNCARCFAEDAEEADERQPPPADAFNIAPNGLESLLRLLERKKKSLLWVADQSLNCRLEQLCESARLSSACDHVHADSVDGCLAAFRSRYMEKDFNVLELVCNDVGAIDSAVSRIAQCSPLNAAICVVFKQKANAVCCLKINR